MNNADKAANIAIGTVIFAAGNKFKVTKSIVWNEGFQSYFVDGIRWVKSKQAWPSLKSQGIMNIGPHFEVVEE